VETVEAGWNILVQANKKEILKTFQNFEKPHDYPELYGRGDTAQQILNALIANI